jgi:cardiolipin synthase
MSSELAQADRSVRAASACHGVRGTAADGLSACGKRPGDQCVLWPTRSTDVYTLFTEGDELFEAMLASIGAARQRIAMETYIYVADEVGWRFGEALAARARAGVQVRLMVDAAGSMSSFSRRLEVYLRRHGVTVRRFHRWSWRKPLQFYRRNHRKLLVVDGHDAFVGGFNIHRESSRAAYGPKRWRDTHVQFSGAMAERASELADGFWDSACVEELPSSRPSGDALVPNHTRNCRHQVHCLYDQLIQSADRRLFVTTPYFVPDHRTQNLLVHAAKRGVDVRLLLPGKSDVPIARWAARAAYRKLLSAGIRIYEYQPRVLHAKTAVVDGVVATVGTANVDFLSFFVNYELNLFSANRALCSTLEEQFRSDLSDAVEMTVSSWSRRPWSGVFTESIGWIARRWL